MKRAQEASDRKVPSWKLEPDTDHHRLGDIEERGRGRGLHSRGDDRRSSFDGRNDRGYDGNRRFEGRRDARDDRPNWRGMDPPRRGHDGFRVRGEWARRNSGGRYNNRRSRSRSRSRSPPRATDSYKPALRRGRSPSPRRRAYSPSRSRSRSRYVPLI